MLAVLHACITLQATPPQTADQQSMLSGQPGAEASLLGAGLTRLPLNVTEVAWYWRALLAAPATHRWGGASFSRGLGLQLVLLACPRSRHWQVQCRPAGFAEQSRYRLVQNTCSALQRSYCLGSPQQACTTYIFRLLPRPRQGLPRCTLLLTATA